MFSTRGKVRPQNACVASVRAADAGELFEAHFDFVWRNVRRLGLRDEEIDDVVQDVFVVVHRRFGEFQGLSQVQTWLYAIIIRVVADHRRASRRRHAVILPSDEALANAASADHAGPAEVVARRQAAALLEKILADMDAERRAIFVAVELEQLPVPEVAVSLGWKLNTAYRRLGLARRDFRLALAAQAPSLGGAR